MGVEFEKASIIVISGLSGGVIGAWMSQLIENPTIFAFSITFVGIISILVIIYFFLRSIKHNNE